MRSLSHASNDDRAARGALVAARYVSPQDTATATPDELVDLIADILAHAKSRGIPANRLAAAALAAIGQPASVVAR